MKRDAAIKRMDAEVSTAAQKTGKRMAHRLVMGTFNSSSSPIIAAAPIATDSPSVSNEVSRSSVQAQIRPPTNATSRPRSSEQRLVRLPSVNQRKLREQSVERVAEQVGNHPENRDANPKPDHSFAKGIEHRQSYSYRTQLFSISDPGPSFVITRKPSLPHGV